ncbi:MAG TPA: CHAT domain-containing protein [Pyrinomonadaceae bacterium]|jgi:CHAT domain-containing protein/tetratricopeptide (TPR) repeat protein|nr:CHAT domain-containing protein [Pyrinomonadaceae bacterium]
MSPSPRTRLSLLFLVAALSFVAAAARAQTPPAALELNVPVEREIAGGESHDYQLSLQAGQCLHLTWAIQKFGPVLTVFAPDGRVVVVVNQEPHGRQKMDVVVLADAAGAYRISVRNSAREPAPLRYRLAAVEVRAAIEQDRKLFAAQSAEIEADRLDAQNTAQGRRDAAAKYEEAAALWREAGDGEDEAASFTNAGRLYAYLAQYQKALDVFGRVLTAARASGDRHAELEAQGNVASIYLELGESRRALEINQQMLPLARELGDRDDEGSILVNTGLIYQDELHDYKSALDYYEEALKIFQEMGDRVREGVALNNIGNAYNRSGDYRAALEYLGRALVLRRETKNRQGEAATLNNMGTVYQAMGESEKALDYFTQSNAIVHAVGYRRGEALTLHWMAEALDRLGRTADAADRMEECIGIMESLRSDLIGEEERATFLSSNEDYYKYYVELLMKLDRQDPSRGYASVALAASERAHARLLLDQLNEARVNLREDVDPALLRRERQAQQQINNATHARWELERGQHTDAQLAASQKEIDDLVARYREIEGRIRASSPHYAALTRPQLLGLAEIQRLVLDPDTLLVEYSLDNHGSYAWLVSRDSAASFALPPRAEIEKTALRFYELLTARARRVKFETPEEKRARVGQADAELQKVGAELSRQLLGPVAVQLGTKRLLVVGDGILHQIPFAALPDPNDQTRPLVFKHEIVNTPSASALAELRREQQGRKPATKGVAVLADPVFEKEDERVKAILNGKGNAPTPKQSNAAAHSSNGAAQSPGGAAQSSSDASRADSSELTRAVREAGVLSEGGLVPRLPFTRREANAIAALIPAQEREEALDFDASRATATSDALGQYRFIHFATHGLLNNDHPELSGVILSLVDRQGREQDGFLRASEIFRLKLPVELVVLSGCRTGLGKEMKGEGLIGLTQGFMYAGASRVVVSLWDVNDAATAELMARFYKAMLGKEHLSPAGALRAAQVSIWQDKRWQSPYYWSAFVLQGEPR